MKTPKFTPTYVAALQDYSRATSKSIPRKSTATTASGGNYQRLLTGASESYVPEDTTISDSSILAELSIRALRLAVRIIKELEYNNALWYFDHTKNKRDAKAIYELRDKGILKPTEDTCIHYVNPFLIRKGNVLAVTAHTADITCNQKVERSMIRSLNKKNIQLNPMDLTELT